MEKQIQQKLEQIASELISFINEKAVNSDFFKVDCRILRDEIFIMPYKESARISFPEWVVDFARGHNLATTVTIDPWFNNCCMVIWIP